MHLSVCVTCLSALCVCVHTHLHGFLLHVWVCMHACRWECLSAIAFTVCVCVCAHGWMWALCLCLQSCLKLCKVSCTLSRFAFLPVTAGQMINLFLKEWDHKRKWPLSYERSHSCRDKSPVRVCIKPQSCPLIIWQIRCRWGWCSSAMFRWVLLLSCMFCDHME